MSLLVMKERPSEVTQWEAYKEFQRALGCRRGPAG